MVKLNYNARKIANYENGDLRNENFSFQSYEINRKEMVPRYIFKEMIDENYFRHKIDNFSSGNYGHLSGKGTPGAKDLSSIEGVSLHLGK